MDRRSFMQLAACAGMTVAGPSAFADDQLDKLVGNPRRSYEPYTGTLWIFVHAGGGWDPTSLCDPKGADFVDQPDRMNNYLKADIETAGNISYAPVGANAAFFQKWHQNTLVVNGIDMKTNGHDAGVRHTWSGRLSEGHPSMAAFIAGAYSPNQPMSFLSFSGFDETGGLVARTRAANTDVLARVAYPDRQNPDDELSSFHSPAVQALIAEFQAKRDEAMIAGQGLPKIRESMRTLFTARSGANELKQLQQYLPDPLPDGAIARQAAVAIAAFRAGICVSANLGIGGFDTHGDHDNSHFPRLDEITIGLDFIMEEAARQGVAEKVFVAVGSDFGRTPGYNDGNGKDHWPVTSMMFMGAGVPGNRVIGKSDERHGVLPNDELGTTMEPGHIANAIRRLAGLDQHDFAAMFPIDMEPANIFSA
jgi:hypothetical protein